MRHPFYRAQFVLERFIVRNPLNRLLLMAGLVIGIAVGAGGLVWLAGLFAQPGEAVWWAFLRLTDPGYLGDDEGTFKRIVSTIVTVLGYVVFMGALIAIMTQWFHATMAHLQSGTTPVAMKNHFVVLGWTNRSAAIVRELVASEKRVRRFYQLKGSDDELRIVILADDPAEHVREELRRVLGPLYSTRRIIVRVGTPLRAKHLLRVDFLNAAAAILPADPGGVDHPTNVDAATVKTLLSTAHAARELLAEDEPLPVVVAEMTDERKVRLGGSAYMGPLETLATDRIIARLIAQNIRHHGVASLYGELLGHAYGNEIYVREWRRPAAPFRVVADSYELAIPIGIVRNTADGFVPELRPALDQTVEQGDRVVMLATDFQFTEVGKDGGAFHDVDEVGAHRASVTLPERRILMLGWNRKVPVLLDELDEFSAEQFHVDLLSMVPPEEREREIDRRIGDLRRARVTHLLADFTSEDDLDDLDLSSYDNIVLLSSDWLETDALADARSILGSLVVHDRLSDMEDPPAVLIELLEPENEDLVARHRDDVVVSPVIVSHMLTHIALRRELGGVFEELFGPHGAEVVMVDPAEYGIELGDVWFDTVRARIAGHADVALGFELSGETLLNPDSGASYRLNEGDRVIALTFY